MQGLKEKKKLRLKIIKKLTSIAPSKSFMHLQNLSITHILQHNVILHMDK